LLDRLSWIAFTVAPSTPPPPAPAAPFFLAAASGSFGRLAGHCFDRLVLHGLDDGVVDIIVRMFVAVEAPLHAHGCPRRWPGQCNRSSDALDSEIRALHPVARLDADGDAVAPLHLGNVGALVIEDIKRHFGGRCRRE
jgi:hypothetical protein